MTILDKVQSLERALCLGHRPGGPLNPRYLTVREVADVTKRHPYTVRRWIREGTLKATRVKQGGAKGRLLVNAEDLASLRQPLSDG